MCPLSAYHCVRLFIDRETHSARYPSPHLHICPLYCLSRLCIRSCRRLCCSLPVNLVAGASRAALLCATTLLRPCRGSSHAKFRTAAALLRKFPHCLRKFRLDYEKSYAAFFGSFGMSNEPILKQNKVMIKSNRTCS